MKKFTIAASVVLCVVCVISLLSFALVSKINSDIDNIERTDKAALVYGRLSADLEAGDASGAEKAVNMLAAKYPNSAYSSSAAEKLAAYYSGSGSAAKAFSYYKVALEKSVEGDEKTRIQAKIDELGSQVTDAAVDIVDTVEYTVQPGDSLFSIAKKFNTTINAIQSANGLKGDLIIAGQKLRVNSAEISIYVDKNKNVLVLKKNGAPFKTYSVATGKANSTPEGVFTIVDKLVKPVWTRPDGKIISPDSPEYELGERWMPFSIAGFGIHGTNDESSIGQQSTRGCVRMKNADVIELYDIIPRGTKVEIVDTAVKSGTVESVVQGEKESGVKTANAGI